MTTSDAPIVKHSNWRFLLRDFISDYPAMRKHPARALSTLLQPAASIAWWLTKVGPAELLQRDTLSLVIAGAGDVECADSGRWLSFIPWMLGMHHLQLSITLVGDELLSNQNGAYASGGLSNSQLDRKHASSFGDVVAGRPPAQVFNGTLGQWREGPGSDVSLDLCVLFSPGFPSHCETWLTETELLPFMRSPIPMAVFGYSKVDSLEDQYLLRLLGVDLAPSEPVASPWRLEHAMSELVGCFAGVAWQMSVLDSDFKIDLNNEEARDYLDLQSYIRHDYEHYGADTAVERMGARWPVVHPQSGKQDAIIVLPRENGFLESDGLLGEFDEQGFHPYEIELFVPEEMRRNRPADDQLIKRAHWAQRIHRDWVSPAINEAKAASAHYF